MELLHHSPPQSLAFKKLGIKYLLFSILRGQGIWGISVPHDVTHPVAPHEWTTRPGRVSGTLHHCSITPSLHHSSQTTHAPHSLCIVATSFVALRLGLSVFQHLIQRCP
jgi:hypothetical protein